MNCLSGSTFTVIPAECTSGTNSGQVKINGVDCPEWQQSATQDMDKQIMTQVRKEYVGEMENDIDSSISMRYFCHGLLCITLWYNAVE